MTSPKSDNCLCVCHIISGDLWAGAEAMACHLLRYLQTCAEIHLTVILLNEGRLAVELREAGIKVCVIEEKHHSFFAIAKSILSVLDGSTQHVLHSHRYKENLLAFLVSRRMKEVKLVTTQHGLPEMQSVSMLSLGRIKSSTNFFILARYFHKIVAVSDSIKMFFTQELKFKPQHIDVIHNGVDVFKGDTPVNSNDRFVVGSSGRLSPVKGYPLFIEIASRVSIRKDFFFVVAGEGPERTELEYVMRKQGLKGSFEFKGHIDDVDSFYAGLDLYVNTSLHEGVPLTILEAMAHGLPIIAPRVGGIPEIIEDGVEGFLIDGRDPSLYASKCMLLYRDRELRRKMSMAAQAKVRRNFSYKRMSEQYRELYSHLKPWC